MRTHNEVSPGAVQVRLRSAIQHAGSQAAFARLANVSRGYVTDLVKGRRDPGPMILKALGLRSVTTTVKVYEEAK